MAGSRTLLHPVEPNKRVLSIDVLKGFAILGILTVTIQSYSLTFAEQYNPTAHEGGALEGYNLWLWFLSHVFAEKKFLAVFAMLFGASIMMLSNKAKKEHLRSGDLQSRRFSWLLIIGLLHAYLLWYGDVLLFFAICGFFMFIFRSKKSRVLFRLGIIFLLVGSLASFILGYSIPFWEPGQLEELEQRVWSPSHELVSQEMEYYRSNWERQMLIRGPQAFRSQTTTFLTDTFWRISGLILLGMAFFKKRVFSLKQTRKYYRKMIAYGLGLGLPLVLVGVLLNFHYDWDFEFGFFYLSQFNYWGSVLMAIGYIGIVMLLVRMSSPKNQFVFRLSQVGQMSLTHYIMQSIICGFIFYGHGLGYFADLDRPLLYIIVLIIWAFQILFSALWLRYFRYGPFEWLWKSLSYGKAQPIFR